MKALSLFAALPLLLVPFAVTAGTFVESAGGKEKLVAPLVASDPPSMATLGGKFNEDLQSAYLDSILQFWSPGDFAFFLNTRTTLDDSQQLLSSYGLGARYLVPGQEIIVGANAYYDSLHSAYDNDFDQLGLGVEVLTRWIDARFNYYAPEGSSYEIDRSSSTGSDRRLGPVFDNAVSRNRILQQRQLTTATTRSTAKRYERAIEGFNAEIGFLVPGLDRYMEMRVFAGAYHYDNPFGGDYSGFKARVEARFLPGLIADVEYWDDAYLMGGHWTGEVRVSLPFSLFNLAKGRNPFEGTAEMFRPRQREFRERMSDMVIRSHRVMTVASSPQPTTSTSQSTDTVTVGQILLQPPRKVVATAPPSEGD